MAQLRNIDQSTGNYSTGQEPGDWLYDARQDQLDFSGASTGSAGPSGAQSGGAYMVPGGIPLGGKFDPTPGDNVPGIPGNAQSPRERPQAPQEPSEGARKPAGAMEAPQGPPPPQGPPRTISPPSLESQLGGPSPQATPRRPMEPTSQAGMVSYPAAAGAAGQGAFRAPQPLDLIGGPGGRLLGKSEGLLEGGLGVPGQMGKGEEDPSKLLALLASLMQG